MKEIWEFNKNDYNSVILREKSKLPLDGKHRHATLAELNPRKMYSSWSLQIRDGQKREIPFFFLSLCAWDDSPETPTTLRACLLTFTPTLNYFIYL